MPILCWKYSRLNSKKIREKKHQKHVNKLFPHNLSTLTIIGFTDIAQGPNFHVHNEK